MQTWCVLANTSRSLPEKKSHKKHVERISCPEGFRAVSNRPERQKMELLRNSAHWAAH